jgi:pilus assembly protein CpaE
MGGSLRIAIVDPDDSQRESLKGMLLGMDMVWLEADCSRYEFFPDIIEQTRPDLGLIAIDKDPNKAIELIQRLRATVPECALLAASRNTDGQLILRAIRAGACEFLTLPLSPDDLTSALERLRSQVQGSSEGSRSCHVIAVIGSTGGVGSTSVAVNMACMLAQTPANTVALLDLDLALGDADVFLDAIPDHTLADVSHNVGRLDFTLLKRSLTKHTTGLYLLPRPVQLQDLELITPEAIQKIVGLLKANFTHVILDLSKSYGMVDLAAMQLADDVLLVAQLDLPCLRNAVRLLMSFEEYENLRSKVRIVVNRSGLDSGQISLRKAKETIGQEIFAQLPNDYRTMVEVRNNGIPLLKHAPKAGITLAIREMLDRLQGNGGGSRDPENEEEPVAAGAPAGGSGWLTFWPKGKKK